MLACLCVPQTWLCSQTHKPGLTSSLLFRYLQFFPPVTVISLHFRTHPQLISSSFFYGPSCSSISSLRSDLPSVSAPCISSWQNTKHMHTYARLSLRSTLEELPFRFGTETQCIVMVHNIYSQTKAWAPERQKEEEDRSFEVNAAHWR